MRKIYSAVQMMFFSVALSAIGSVITNIESLSSLGSFMTAGGGIMTIVALYSLRFENRRFSKSLRLFWISVALVIGLSILAGVAIASMLGQESVTLAMIGSVIVIIISVALLVIEIMMQYQLYAGFDEMRGARAFDYPAKRIMWCFYLAIISMIVSFVAIIGMMPSLLSVISTGELASSSEQLLETISNIVLVANVLIEAIHLWLIFTYMQAAREALENEEMSGWN